MVSQTVERMAYSPQEAAASVGLSIGTIYNLIKSGKLAAFKCERRILISRANLEAFVNQESTKRRGLVDRITGVKG
jgi:excisionase family DNA binding protein